MILTIIQARMSSKRLPGKVMMNLHGKPMLQWVLEAALGAELVDKVIVATSCKKEDDQIIDFAKKYGDVFCGDLNNVLDRYYKAASYYKPNHIVRLTGDCPLLTPDLINRVINQHLIEGNDYTWNRDSWPSGFDVEVFTMNTLCRVWKEAISSYDQEHVTSYIRNNPGKFKIGSFDEKAKGILGKWSVDTMADYENVSDAFFLFKGGKL